MRFAKVISAGSALAVSLFLSGSSEAGLGIECMATAAGSFASNEGIFFSSGVTGPIGANCKIRESSINPQATYVFKVSDTSSTHNISCSVIRINSAGAATWASTGVSTSGFPGTQDLTISLASPGGTGNTWLLSCSRSGSGTVVGSVGIKSFSN